MCKAEAKPKGASESESEGEEWRPRASSSSAGGGWPPPRPPCSPNSPPKLGPVKPGPQASQASLPPDAMERLGRLQLGTLEPSSALTALRSVSSERPFISKMPAKHGVVMAMTVSSLALELKMHVPEELHRATGEDGMAANLLAACALLRLQDRLHQLQPEPAQASPALKKLPELHSKISTLKTQLTTLRATFKPKQKSERKPGERPAKEQALIRDIVHELGTSPLPFPQLSNQFAARFKLLNISKRFSLWLKNIPSISVPEQLTQTSVVRLRHRLTRPRSPRRSPRRSRHRSRSPQSQRPQKRSRSPQAQRPWERTNLRAFAKEGNTIE